MNNELKTWERDLEQSDSVLNSCLDYKEGIMNPMPIEIKKPLKS